MKRIFSLALSAFVAYQPVLASNFRYDHYLVKNIAFDYQSLKSKQDFLKKFGSGLLPQDQKELEKNLKILPELPKIKVSGNWVKFSADSLQLTIDLNRAAGKIVTINGIQVAFDRKAPMAPQVDVLIQKLKKQGQEVSRFDLIIPKAHALAPVILGAMGFVAMAFVGKVIDRYANAALDVVDYNACWVMNDKIKVLTESSPVCREYLKQQKDLASKNPEVQALKEALKEVTPAEPIDVSIESCPHASGDQTYRSSVIFLNERMAKARVQVSFDGPLVKDFKVLDFNSNKVLATYILKDQTLNGIRLPNPTPSGDKPAPTEIEISATEEIKDPLLSAEQKFHKSLFAKIGQRLGACKAEADAVHTKSQQNQGTK